MFPQADLPPHDVCQREHDLPPLWSRLAKIAQRCPQGSALQYQQKSFDTAVTISQQPDPISERAFRFCSNHDRQCFTSGRSISIFAQQGRVSL